MRRIAIPVMVAVMALVASAGAAAAAGGHIRPHQFFLGEINGQAATSSISVTGCSSAGVGGHPIFGQSAEVVSIAPPTTTPAGFTGGAHRIAVDLEVPSPDPMLPLIQVIHLGQLDSYRTPLAISPFLTLPCRGTATAIFSPVAGGPRAIDSRVRVTFVSPQIVPSRSRAIPPGKVITLTGSGFAPNASYRVVECSQSSWIAPQNPCVAGNGIDVTTGADGGFTHAFTVEACTAISPSTLETCFIGAPMGFGIDTIQLVGAAKITVQLH